MLATFIGFLLAIDATILGFRFIRRAVRKSIWRLRNRLFVTWTFLGAVPIF